MTIAGWVIFGFAALIIILVAVVVFKVSNKAIFKVASVVIGLVLLTGVFLGMRWYFNSTASGQRAMVDEKSNLEGGIHRTVTVYTANGEIIAKYQGKIDVEANDGGYIKFDYDGKRYIYYNCFVETIADLEDAP